ncbi:HAD-IIA family hydrolase [Actinotalea sp. K2]|uniref:HAD-IIA family hydrolase n=1 Tax=Actinotalea sp. K2 TaxID=2939438 RepID=UPI002017367C|nr:HAD-IIA family hydrolase [Actinotalea sp. K2]MCL3863136.1 HAD-IIA family hydrolase [Actinotalea sp. K2]
MADRRALLVDIDGVLVVSWQALPGAVDALRALRSAHVPLRLLTNTTSRTREQITQALRRAGFEIASDEVITVTAAAAEHLTRHHPGARCLFLNSGEGGSDLAALADVVLVGPEASPGNVDVVLLGGAGPELSYDALNHALACLLEGATLLAMHRNLLWRTSSGMQLDTGAFLGGLEAAAGVTATVIGKPAPAAFEGAMRSLGSRPQETVMVGDDLDSDVRAAQRLGLTGVQVRTGKFRPAQLEDGEAPDVLLDSFADLPGWLGL